MYTKNSGVSYKKRRKIADFHVMLFAGSVLFPSLNLDDESQLEHFLLLLDHV